MGNPQHLEWLLEGVEAWNARREWEDFEPDLSGFDIRGAYYEAGIRPANVRIPLKGVNLRHANLEDAILTGADLRWADLSYARFRTADLVRANLEQANLHRVLLVRAKLTEAEFKGANLTAADLSGANLEDASIMMANLTNADLRICRLGETNLREADLTGVKVTTIYTKLGPTDGGTPTYTDLSASIGLTQEQVDMMDGDTGTILPEGLEHPPHWPDPHVPEELDETNADDPESAAPNGANEPLDQSPVLTGKENGIAPSPASATPELRAHVAFLLKTAPASAGTAEHVAAQIEQAVCDARINSPEDPELLLGFATALRSVAGALKQADAKDLRIAELEAIVAQQKDEIERLVGLLANQPSARRQILIAALGSAGATALVGTCGYLFGPDGAELVSKIWDVLTTSGLPPAPPPPTLPPTTSI
ncbi:pentapeptide repeat-containing protein [Actibacterium sp. XHP0104]|uniref:pentapeptide repeat-containing protein n=1 Tax=Actibacterium sp. XHP0104 TaxID=2984335 RepID=UPI0021E967C8|nr:pentapeptide repeat-containing protein [Actibacterium sp. XHP0104]MCV2880706.1 pentapeptide repeat-containing protein [Actibacterium sp. XHP0104]